MSAIDLRSDTVTRPTPSERVPVKGIQLVDPVWAIQDPSTGAILEDGLKTYSAARSADATGVIVRSLVEVD